MTHTSPSELGLNCSANPGDVPITQRQPSRLPALDFTKGALVLIMVLYHWLNYFVSPVGNFYKYLRFLTPSFIFISGFLISHIYLVRYSLNETHVPKRLLQRGLKTLGIFIFLNAVRSLVIPDVRSGNVASTPWAIQNLVAIFVTGNVSSAGTGKAAAFYILVPIGYLLLLSAGLAILSRYWKYTFHAVCLALLLAIAILSLNGVGYGNLELLAVGLLGVAVGYLSIGTINSLLAHRMALAVGYVLYTVIITLWNVTYPVQIIGVCLNVMVVYLVGSSDVAQGRVGGVVMLLGKYSLFGYIVQIAILQALYRGLRPLNLETVELAVSFFAAFTLTIASVELLDRARGKSAILNRMYKAVFA